MTARPITKIWLQLGKHVTSTFTVPWATIETREWNCLVHCLLAKLHGTYVLPTPTARRDHSKTSKSEVGFDSRCLFHVESARGYSRLVHLNHPIVLLVAILP